LDSLVGETSEELNCNVFVPIPVRDIVALSIPSRQNSSLIEAARESLVNLHGENLFMGSLAAEDLSPDQIDQIIKMRYQVFKMGKGWLTPPYDWNGIDINPNTSHQLLLNADGSILASSRTIVETITPNDNSHSPLLVVRSSFTALNELNRGVDDPAGQNGSVLERISSVIPSSNGSLFGTIERLTFSPEQLQGMQNRLTIGAALLVQSPVALRAFVDLDNCQTGIIQADDAMSQIFIQTFGNGMREIMVTNQKRRKALYDHVSPDPEGELIDDPCHTFIFDPTSLTAIVKDYNPALYKSYITLKQTSQRTL